MNKSSKKITVVTNASEPDKQFVIMKAYGDDEASVDQLIKKIVEWAEEQKFAYKVGVNIADTQKLRKEFESNG